MKMDGLPWYAIRVQSKFEQVVSQALRSKGFEEFLPLYAAQRRWSDRIKRRDMPLFPGYLFCRLDVRDRLLPILTTPGVMNIVGAGRTPVPVGEEEIAAVRKVLQSGLAAQACPLLSAGSRVYIARGPLAGLEGVIVRGDVACKLVISVSLLQRSIAVEIDREWARPVVADSHVDAASGAIGDRRHAGRKVEGSL
jgi:transcription antitermination factor NusG